jgi:hypothetical protein
VMLTWCLSDHYITNSHTRGFSGIHVKSTATRLRCFTFHSPRTLPQFCFPWIAVATQQWFVLLPCRQSSVISYLNDVSARMRRHHFPFTWLITQVSIWPIASDIIVCDTFTIKTATLLTCTTSYSL